MRVAAIVVGLAVFGLDYLTKVIVQKTFWLWNYSVLDGLLTIQYATNEGIAFGLLHNVQSSWKAPLLGLMALTALALVLYYIWTTPREERFVLLALGLLLGGILGNFVDRLGDESVVDFIKVHWGTSFAWPTFNVADSAITTGVILILLLTFFGAKPEEAPDSPGLNIEN